MFVSRWASSEVLGSGVALCYLFLSLIYGTSLLRLAQLPDPSLLISLQLLSLAILFYLLLCPFAHTFPVSFASLCLTGSVL